MLSLHLQTSSPPVQSPTDSTTAPLPTDSPTAAIVVTSTLSPTAISTSPPTTAIPGPTPNPTVSVPATLTCPDTLDRSTEIDSGATLYYAVVPSDSAGSGNGLLCGCLEADNDGWIGIGFSSDGSVAGSRGIIGIPAQGTVLKYDLTSYSSVTPMSEDRQTLSGISVTEVDGKVTMEFAKLLVEEGEVPIMEDTDIIFIYAAGSDELGYHTFRISRVVTL
jgi:hypothetical protein